MSNPTSQSSQALAVLRDTVKRAPDLQERPSAATAATATGVRLLNMINSMGWLPRKQLTMAQIIQISAVLVCLDVLSQDIGKVPLYMMRRLPNKGKAIVEPNEHPVAAMLAMEPNRHFTWTEFKEMMMLHLGVAQNCFIGKEKDRATGKMTGLRICMPGRVTILAVSPDDDSRGLGYYAYDTRLRLDPHEKIQMALLPGIMLEDEMIHLRGRMFDGLAGYSNLDAGARTFGLASELIDYQTRLYTNDGSTRGVFQHPGEIGDSANQDAFDRLRAQLAEQLTAMTRKNLPIVLEEGMTFESISMNADQAEASKSRDAAVVDVARTFRIPPHKIMHLINVKYENMETLEKSYVNDTLIPYCERIEAKFARSLLTPQERLDFFFEFDRIEMLLNDIEKLAEVVEKLVKVGAITRDEVRQRLGWNPMSGNAGKTYIIPSTYNLVDENNKVIIAAGAQPAAGAAGATDPAKPAKPAKPKKDAEGDDDNVFTFPSLSGER